MTCGIPYHQVGPNFLTLWHPISFPHYGPTPNAPDICSPTTIQAILHSLPGPPNRLTTLGLELHSSCHCVQDSDCNPCTGHCPSLHRIESISPTLLPTTKHFATLLDVLPTLMQALTHYCLGIETRNRISTQPTPTFVGSSSPITRCKRLNI
jgi:hypothetical protein